jgi:hypothetical protein
MDERLKVSFDSKHSDYEGCLCACCHGTGKVLKVMMPSTLYHDGKQLTVKYSPLWICDDCREKLLRALQKEGC